MDVRSRVQTLDLRGTVRIQKDKIYKKIKNSIDFLEIIWYNYHRG